MQTKNWEKRQNLTGHIPRFQNCCSKAHLLGPLSSLPRLPGLTLFLVRSNCSRCSPSSSMISEPIWSVSVAIRWERSILWVARFRLSVPCKSNTRWDCSWFWQDYEREMLDFFHIFCQHNPYHCSYGRRDTACKSFHYFKTTKDAHEL